MSEEDDLIAMRRQIDEFVRQYGYADIVEFLKEFIHRCGYNDQSKMLEDALLWQLHKKPGILGEMLREGKEKMEKNKEPTKMNPRIPSSLCLHCKQPHNGPYAICNKCRKECEEISKQ